MNYLSFVVHPSKVTQKDITELPPEFVLKYSNEPLVAIEVHYEVKSYSSHDEEYLTKFIIPCRVMEEKVKPILDRGEERENSIVFNNPEDEEDLLDLLWDLEDQGETFSIEQI